MWWKYISFYNYPIHPHNLAFKTLIMPSLPLGGLQPICQAYPISANLSNQANTKFSIRWSARISSNALIAKSELKENNTDKHSSLSRSYTKAAFPHTRPGEANKHEQIPSPKRLPCSLTLILPLASEKL